jgi:serine/threonine protein kinase
MVKPLSPQTPACLDHPRGPRFVIVDTIGQGSFGITYRATDRLFDNSPVVVKELACEGMCWRNPQTLKLEPAGTTEEARNRWEHLKAKFIREAEILQRLQSPHLVRVVWSWEERGTAYYAMQEVDGARTLSQVHPDPPGWRAAQRLAEELLSALEVIHGENVLHLDVKPDNVLVARDGHLVLIDFGTALMVRELQRTLPMVHAATSGYAPPELMALDLLRQAGRWSDLYSWAMVVYGLVVRHPGPEGWPLDALVRSVKPQQGVE